MFYLLLYAPLPACLMGIILMYVHGLSPLIWGQQLGVFGLALIICGFSQRVMSKSHTGQSSSRWLAFFLLCIWFSSLGGSLEEPQRWLYLGPFRLYTASIFLPSVFVLLMDAQRRELFSELWQAVIYLLITMALILQPDLAQVTAFTATAVFSFAFMGFSWMRLSTAVILAVCTVGSWMNPDPLAPVLHVEGVLDLAWQIHPTLFGFSLVSLCLPCITLLWNGKHQQAKYFSVAFYYFLVGCLAAFAQMTPMPILGFGAGPILGYFLMLSFAHQTVPETELIKKPGEPG